MAALMAPSGLRPSSSETCAALVQTQDQVGTKHGVDSTQGGYNDADMDNPRALYLLDYMASSWVYGGLEPPQLEGMA